MEWWEDWSGGAAGGLERWEDWKGERIGKVRGLERWEDWSGGGQCQARRAGSISASTPVEHFYHISTHLLFPFYAKSTSLQQILSSSRFTVFLNHTHTLCQSFNLLQIKSKIFIQNLTWDAQSIEHSTGNPNNPWTTKRNGIQDHGKNSTI